MKKAAIVIIVLIILVGAFFYLFYSSSSEPLLKINFYDKEGKKANFLSLVKVPGYVYYIDLTATIKNTGPVALACRITNYSPPDLNFQSTLYLVDAYKYFQWTSDRLRVSDFMGTNNFSVNISCYTNEGSGNAIYLNRSGNISLTLEPACGDGVCQTGEDQDNCASDCFLDGKKVRFRTASLRYTEWLGGVDSAIAFAENCGSDLIWYGDQGYTSATGPIGDPLIDVPGSFGSGNCAVNSLKLYRYYEDGFLIGGYTYNPSGCISAWQGIIFKPGSDSTATVELYPRTLDSKREVNCGVGNAVFRTSNLSYQSFFPIYYSQTCGENLRGYSYSTKYSVYANNCQATILARVSGCGIATKLLSVPGSWLVGSTGSELWQCSGKIGYLYVCNTIGTSSQVKAFYNTEDYRSYFSEDENAEVSC